MSKHPFEYQAPTEEQIADIATLRRAFKMLYETIVFSVPHCRERSLAITALEQASMWINKAIVFEEE